MMAINVFVGVVQSNYYIDIVDVSIYIYYEYICGLHYTQWQTKYILVLVLEAAERTTPYASTIIAQQNVIVYTQNDVHVTMMMGNIK